MWGDIAIAFLLALITSFVVTPYTIKLARKVGAVDTPKDERRVNTKPMPRLRRHSSYFRIFSFNSLFINNNEYRRLSKSFWGRTVWC